jgi:hypothetical protein
MLSTAKFLLESSWTFLSDEGDIELTVMYEALYASSLASTITSSVWVAELASISISPSFDWSFDRNVRRGFKLRGSFIR